MEASTIDIAGDAALLMEEACVVVQHILNEDEDLARILFRGFKLK